MPIFHFPLFLLSPLIITTFPTLMLTALDLHCMLCISRRAVTYPRCHLLQAAPLHLFTYFYRFRQFRSSSSSSLSCSRQPSLCLCQVSCYLELKFDTGCPLLCKWEVCFSCLSQNLAVLFLIHSNANLFFLVTCKVLAGSPQLIFQNVLPNHFAAAWKGLTLSE